MNNPVQTFLKDYKTRRVQVLNDEDMPTRRHINDDSYHVSAVKKHEAQCDFLTYNCHLNFHHAVGKQ